MDLAEWAGRNYEPPFWTAVKLYFGAHRWRCEYCRINFASFRKRKEVFTFGRWRRMNSGKAIIEGRARIAELERKAAEARVLAEDQARLEAREQFLAALEAERDERTSRVHGTI
jgi:hypothetical protein